MPNLLKLLQHFLDWGTIQILGDRGVQEYWLVDWRLQQLEIYQLKDQSLEIVKTLSVSDKITTPLLSKFSCNLENFFV
jgi:Uma2 family endonuclease